jgi:hypothetical protein
MQSSLILKRASASRPSGEWNDDDYDVLCDCFVIGRIMKAAAVPLGMSWLWTLAFGYHEDRTPTHCYARGSHSGIREELAAGSTPFLSIATCSSFAMEATSAPRHYSGTG